MTSGIQSWLKSNFPDIDLIHFDNDKGVPYRLNVAFKHTISKAKYIAYLHEDMCFDKNWLSHLVTVMEKNPSIGAVQPLLLDFTHPERIDCREALIDYLGYSYLPAKDRVIRSSYDGFIESSYIGLGLYRSEALKKASFQFEYFDSDYLIHWFDIDLSWRIILAKYKIRVILNSIIYHNRGISKKREKLPDKNVFINNRNWIITLIKNYSLFSLLLIFLPLSIFKTIEFLALMKKNQKHAIATVQGLIWPIKNLKKICSKRAYIQKNVRKIADSQVRKNFVRPNIFLLYKILESHYCNSEYTTDFPIPEKFQRKMDIC